MKSLKHPAGGAVAKSTNRSEIKKKIAVKTSPKKEATTIIPNATKIHVTSDYNMFRIRKTNRPVSDTYVAQLVESIKNVDMTNNFPIVCTQDFEIIDGQHRYFACMELGLPIKYTVVERKMTENQTDEVTVTLNTNQRQWTLPEFVHLYAERGVLSYIAVRNCIQEFGFPVSVALIVVANGEKGNMRASSVRAGKLKQGTVGFREISRALLQIKQIFRYATTGKFVKAFIKIYLSDKYDHERDYQKLVKYRMDMMQCATGGQYVKMLAEILNKGREKQNRFDIIELIDSVELNDAGVEATGTDD